MKGRDVDATAACSTADGDEAAAECSVDLPLHLTVKILC
jgi:hypothetical protein